MSEEIKIETGIPIPGAKGSPELIPLVKQMNVGDSILILKSQYNTINSAAFRLGFRITCRKVDATHKRIWRVK